MARQAVRTFSSLPLQMLIYFNIWYDYVYFFVAVASFIYKGVNLPYPKDYLAIEVSVLVLFFLLEILRLHLGSRGNKTERNIPLAFFFVMSAVAIALSVYFLSAQIYVLRLEVVTNSLLLVFVCLQFCLTIVVMIIFCRKQAYS